VRFTEGALQVIERYAWPGNIRQLFNVIRVAIALLDDDETTVHESHLPEELFEAPLAPASGEAQWAAAPLENPVGSLEEVGRQLAQRALDQANGNVSAAARQLGISRNTLYRKLGKL
jgi:transcriptional regulator of acetoin/glycerol metabolism